MSRWFRFYDEALDDPKVQSLPSDLFKSWVNLLCIASRHDGKIPSIEACAFGLRMPTDGVSTVLQRLSNAGLLDTRSGGPHGMHYAVHGWEKRQYKSDTSTNRVKRFRKRSDIVSETPPETEAETEQNKGSEPNGSGAEAPADFEVLVFRRGKAVLGKSAGGVIAQLKRHCRDDLTATMSLIDQAAQKENPMEWVQAFLRKPDPDAEIYRNVL